MSKKSNKEKKYKTLLSVIANGSTDDARALLIKNSGEDAKNEQDLEGKLARMYANSSSKIDIEKQFAEIHPHKDFILKYIKPEIQVAKTLDSPIVVDEKIIDSGKIIVTSDTPNCNCNKTSNCCGNENNYSNATGESQVSTNSNNNQTALVLGLVSVVAIFGMVLYLKQNK